MNVTVFTKPACQPCRLTKKKFNELDIGFTEQELSDPQRFIDMGLIAVPVTEVDLGEGAIWRWAGYRPSQIEVLNHVYGCADPECSQCEAFL